MHPRLIQKLEKIKLNQNEFILADARDADMAWGRSAFGINQSENRLKSFDEFGEDIQQMIDAGDVDIILASASMQLDLIQNKNAYHKTDLTPAIRYNDTSDIWLPRGLDYRDKASRPFRSVHLKQIKNSDMGKSPIDLGLYSVTFNGQLESDLASMEAFHKFRLEAADLKMNYFLEVFAPNLTTSIAEEELPYYMNDMTIRMLAGVPKSNWPAFLKIPYPGPKAMEELASWSSDLIPGILGGSSGTSFDAFTLLADAQKYGARVALFGRKIKLAESPVLFASVLRKIVRAELKPTEAVKYYHSQLKDENISPLRDLEEDLKLSDQVLMHYS